MSDENSLIPISDEQAKAIQEIVGAGRDAGGYLANMLGDLPKDLVGYLIGDKLKARRISQWAALWSKTQIHLSKMGVQEPEPPNLKLALPILVEAADENREELQNLWARLLAASMHPERSKCFMLKFIEVVKRLDPIDASVMVWVSANGYEIKPDESQKIQTDLELSFDEVMVSVGNLTELGFFRHLPAIGNKYLLTPFCREFLRVVQY